MTTEPVAGHPLSHAGKTRRKRGQAVLSRLPNTDAFTNHRMLSIGDRMLILFLLVALVDEHGCLTQLHERIAAAAAADPQHWARDRPVEKLPNSTAKWLGKAAVRRPPWERIVEFLQLSYPPEHLPIVLAIAAGLYCNADQLPRPSPDYHGPRHRPTWSHQTRASTETIRADLNALLAPSNAPDDTAGDSAGEGTGRIGQHELLAVLEERDSYKAMLVTVLRDFNVLEKYAQQQRAKAEYWEKAVGANGEQFVELHQLQLKYRLQRRQLERLRRAYVDLALAVNRGVTRKTVDAMLEDQLAGTDKMPHRPHWEFTTGAHRHADETEPPGQTALAE